MRIELNECGKIVCTMENANHFFLSELRYNLRGFDRQGRLQFAYFGDEDKDKWSYPEVGEESDYLALSDVLYYARKYGIEVAEEVTELYEKWRKTYEKCELRRARIAAEKARKAKYALYCEIGCKGCTECTQENDIFICRHSGVVLNERRGAWENSYVYKPFVSVPIPTDGCKYQKEENGICVNSEG